MERKVKKMPLSILILVGSVMFVQVAELLFNRNGIELRTAAQGIKGLYVWFIAPFLLLAECFRLLSAKVKSRVGKSLSTLLLAVFVLMLLGAGFFRGICYIFSDKFVEETVLEDGVLEGKYSQGLRSTQTRYYEPIFGIFRREFSGWDEEEITAKFRERCGADAKPVGDSAPYADKEQGQSADFIARYNGDYEKECELSGGTTKFRMLVLDAAAGSRLYGLIKSTDAGESWEVVSLDPFAGQLGMGIDFTFLDENLGFATLAHNGGDAADLYMTEDGGRSYVLVSLPDVTVTLDNGYRYHPYDFPQMPYEQDGKLYVYCGQGADGDYAGGDAAGMALYESADGGRTFTYVGIE